MISPVRYLVGACGEWEFEPMHYAANRRARHHPDGAHVETRDKGGQSRRAPRAGAYNSTFGSGLGAGFSRAVASCRGGSAFTSLRGAGLMARAMGGAEASMRGMVRLSSVMSLL